MPALFLRCSVVVTAPSRSRHAHWTTDPDMESFDFVMCQITQLGRSYGNHHPCAHLQPILLRTHMRLASAFLYALLFRAIGPKALPANNAPLGIGLSRIE